jgi:hypothetical protein
MMHKIEVVMLPTDDNINIHRTVNRKFFPPYLMYLESGIYSKDNKNYGSNQHVYITVSQDVEPIKVDDWFYNIKSNNIFKNDSEKTLLKSDTEFKIIATTDPKLNLSNKYIPYDLIPELQQSFLKEFVASNSNGEFEVEYTNCSVIYFKWKNGIHKVSSKLKLNQDNTVNITSVKEKMLPISEVSQLMHDMLRANNEATIGTDGVFFLNDWIKENL